MLDPTSKEEPIINIDKYLAEKAKKIGLVLIKILEHPDYVQNYYCYLLGEPRTWRYATACLSLTGIENMQSDELIKELLDCRFCNTVSVLRKGLNRNDSTYV